MLQGSHCLHSLGYFSDRLPLCCLSDFKKHGDINVLVFYCTILVLDGSRFPKPTLPVIVIPIYQLRGTLFVTAGLTFALHMDYDGILHRTRCYHR